MATVGVDASGKLFDRLKNIHQLKNDAALARELKTAAPVISKIRHGHTDVTPLMILTVHETFDMPVAEIRELIGS